MKIKGEERNTKVRALPCTQGKEARRWLPPLQTLGHLYRRRGTPLHNLDLDTDPYTLLEEPH